MASEGCGRGQAARATAATAWIAGSRVPPDVPRVFGWLFVVLGALFACAFQAMAVTLAVAGTYLRRRRRWLFCVVVDAVACSLFPFRTVLGVVTLVSLSEPEVKARFS